MARGVQCAVGVALYGEGLRTAAEPVEVDIFCRHRRQESPGWLSGGFADIVDLQRVTWSLRSGAAVQGYNLSLSGEPFGLKVLASSAVSVHLTTPSYAVAAACVPEPGALSANRMLARRSAEASVLFVLVESSVRGGVASRSTTAPRQVVVTAIRTTKSGWNPSNVKGGMPDPGTPPSHPTARWVVAYSPPSRDGCRSWCRFDR